MDINKFNFSRIHLDLEDFELNEMIGKGAYMIVFRAENRKTHEVVAVKVFNEEYFNRKRKQIYLLIDITLPFLLNLPGIVKIKGFRFPLVDEERTKDKLLKIKPTPENKLKWHLDLTGAIIFSEYMPNGNLETINYDYLTSNGLLNEKMNPTIRSKIIFGIAAIMKSVHKYNVIHGDLNPHNILLDENLEPNISGFMFSKFVSNDMELAIGNPLYMAPELFMDVDETYTSSIDVFAFAIIIFKMFSFKVSFGEKIRLRSSQQYMRLIGRGKRPCRPDSIPDCYWELIQNCWDQKPDKRPTFDEICEILKSDNFAIEEFGMKTDVDELHEYQDRIDQDLPEKTIEITSPRYQIIEVKGNDVVILKKSSNLHHTKFKRYGRIIRFNWYRH